MRPSGAPASGGTAERSAGCHIAGASTAVLSQGRQNPPSPGRLLYSKVIHPGTPPNAR